MSPFLSRQTETFIIRLWVEYLEQVPPTWRGEIERVGSKEVMHFGNLDEVSDHIRRCIEAGQQPDKTEDA